MYSGFLTVDSTTNRRLFYWFAEAKSNVTEKPVVLWFNGGPGCSSLLGFLSENGPLEARNDGTVGEHGLSWNGLANTLYIESPAFVGFSTSDDSRDRQSNDTKTADDNFRALQAFYAKFPEFKSQPFYLTGESYAGNYVPQLADAIVGGDDATLRSSFAGFAVGNPVFSCNGASFVDIASKFQGELWFYHALLPIDIYTAWLDTGCSSLNPGANATRCQQLTNKMGNLIGTYDPYDLYSDPCTGNSTIGIPEEDKARCKDYTTVATAWLNRADVQAALHVIPSASHAPVAWTSCSNTLEYTVTWPDSAQYYSRVAAAPTKPRILVFSGDVDIAVCPAPTAQYCLNQFGSQRTGQWRQWTVNGYTAGYVQEYADYTYATVKGAGHLASTTQPWAMYNLLERFLSGGQL